MALDGASRAGRQTCAAMGVYAVLRIALDGCSKAGRQNLGGHGRLRRCKDGLERPLQGRASIQV
jgi:hypothetical protein